MDAIKNPILLGRRQTMAGDEADCPPSPLSAKNSLAADKFGGRR